MVKTKLKNESLKNIELFKEVVEFKKKFYQSCWARYEDFYNGDVRLIPGKKAIAIFTEDYHKMQEMIFGEIPTFEVILDTIAHYNEEINISIKQTLK